MKLNSGLALLLSLALAPGLRADAPAAAPEPSAAHAPPEAPASPYAILESLIGGVWSGPIAAGKDGVPRVIELHFAWAENRQGVRFASWIVHGSHRSPYVSGMYAWDAAKGKLRMFYTDSGGSLTDGLVAVDGNVLTHDLTETNKDASVDTVRVKLTKLDDDVFTNEVFMLADGNYARIAEVRYEREPDLTHQP